MTDDGQYEIDEFPSSDGIEEAPADDDYGFDVEKEEAIREATITALNYRRELVNSTSARDAEAEDRDGGPDESPNSLIGLAGQIIDTAGSYAGKYDPPVALSTHILNAVVVGLNAYVYDRCVRLDKAPDSEEAALLIAGLALHDANKFVESAYDPADLDTTENSEAVIEYYFEQGDALGLLPFLSKNTATDQEVDLADVKWLVQRTETKESTTDTQGQATRRVRGLEKYCRIGDGFVSKQGQDGLASAAEWLTQFFAETDSTHGGPHVHYLQFNEIEQSVLNNHLLATVKEIIGNPDPDTAAITTPPHGIVLGSTPDGILYLGESIDRYRLQEAVTDGLMQRVTREHSFSAKTEWNSFEYDILAEIDIPFEEKRSIIAEGYAETLRNGSGTDHEFESISEGYKQALPELARTVFREQNYDDAFEAYPVLARLWEDISASDEYSAYSQKIGFLAELFRRFSGAVEDGYDPKTVQQEVSEFASSQRANLEADLEPESEAGGIVSQRFFEVGVATDLTVPPSDAMCFLCGRPAERQYQKAGDAFYKTQSFSRRVAAEGSYKRICSACNLEHALLRDLVEDTGYSVGSDIKIAFVYYDEFVGNLTIGTRGNPRRLIRFLTSDEDEDRPDVSDPSLVADSFVPQYHLHPFYASSENDRLRVVRGLLEALVTRGFKVVIGKPFAGFRPQDALLSDLNPTRRQTAFGADRITSFSELERVRRLFDILRSVADSSDYSSGRELTSIQRDGFQPIADLVAQESEWYESVRDRSHEYFTTDDFPETDQYMMMREVAREGLNVYGQQYNSRYKKTKVFRLALDAVLDSLNSGKEDTELTEHVSGQVYKSALEEDYSGRVTTEQVTQFVEKLLEFLKEDGSLNKQTLSRRRNTLTNTYLFAYDRLLNELQSEDDEETPAEAESDD